MYIIIKLGNLIYESNRSYLINMITKDRFSYIYTIFNIPTQTKKAYPKFVWSRLALFTFNFVCHSLDLPDNVSAGLF